jgi:L-malate glycosyltransferase
MSEPAKKMNVGIVCYASIGGSGIIATELGKALATRGHRVHILSSDTPFRFGTYQPGMTFHKVDTPSYPLFREPQYILTLANKIVQVSRDEHLDVIHAHYAIPHATAAYLARQILASSNGGPVPRVITTLHGTDITLLGADRSYTKAVAFCIEQSDGVTAVSQNLKDETIDELGVRCEIRVIPNFLDCKVHRRVEASDLRRALAPEGQRLVIHVSNFRPVKRTGVVVEIFKRIRERVPSRLLMVGDGPELRETQRLARSLGLGADVEFLGEQEQVQPLLSASDLFLLPSSSESFGLAGLEAMACEVPVVAARVGGIPEVIEDGVSGFLFDLDDRDGMAEMGVRLLSDQGLHDRVAAAARHRVTDQFCDSKIVPRYEAYYREVLAR